MADDKFEITERRRVPNAVVLAKLSWSLENVGVGAISHLTSAKRAILEARDRVRSNSRL